jgi:hypothetical protein
MSGDQGAVSFEADCAVAEVDGKREGGGWNSECEGRRGAVTCGFEDAWRHCFG